MEITYGDSPHTWWSLAWMMMILWWPWWCVGWYGGAPIGDWSSWCLSVMVAWWWLEAMFLLSDGCAWMREPMWWVKLLLVMSIPLPLCSFYPFTLPTLALAPFILLLHANPFLNLTLYLLALYTSLNPSFYTALALLLLLNLTRPLTLPLFLS